MSKQNLTRRGFLKGVTAGSTGVALLSLPPEAATPRNPLPSQAKTIPWRSRTEREHFTS